MRTFLPAMCPAFFIRVSPASRNAKPACMNITRTAVMTTQIVDAAINRSWFLGTDLHLLQSSSSAVVEHVRDRGRPHEPVARLVAAPGRIDDRGDGVLDDPVRDDERQQRLRQEPRFEDPAAVLVRDTTLAPVPDRLDHRHTDMARRLFDRVDHRLDPFTEHDRLDLHHSFSSSCSPTKKEASGTHGRCARGLDASPGRRLRRTGRARYYTK